jgi:hypothetical protein
MVPAAGPVAFLDLDHVAEDVGGAVEHGVVRLSPRQHNHAGTIGHRLGPFGAQALVKLRIAKLGPQRGAIVDQDTLLQIGRQRIVRKIGFLPA